MSRQVQSISVKGKQRAVPVLRIGPKAVVLIRGTILKIGEVHDEFWLESKDVPEPQEIIEKLKQSSAQPDLFTFAQKLPDVSPRYPYHLEWDNLAVANFESYSQWFEKKVNRSVRKHIRNSFREGVRVEVVPFTDDLVKGILSIYNELSVRQGRRFWHYGKSFETVKSENGTYLDRSLFIGAYYLKELIGFLKIVFHDEVASLMQILSKAGYSDKRPTNALLSKAVEICDSKGFRYLTYGEYVYGKKVQSSLTDFKRNNGFERIDIPRYYVHLTAKGRVALGLRLHKGVGMLVPSSVRSTVLALREKWYKLRS